jgi:hypothetical protein
MARELLAAIGISPCRSSRPDDAGTIHTGWRMGTRARIARSDALIYSSTERSCGACSTPIGARGLGRQLQGEGTRQADLESAT